MKRVFSLVLLSVCCLVPVSASGQQSGYYRAASSTARSITGDVTLAAEKITINFFTTAISKARPLSATEISSVFDADSSAPGGAASLYRLNISSDHLFLHKNTLCGHENVQWMVAYTASGTMQLAFFSGDKPPVLTFDAVRNSTDLCGTFTYVK
jgi:hypothetical protein